MGCEIDCRASSAFVFRTSDGVSSISMQLMQAWYGYTAIKKLIAKQTADFSRLCREDELASLAARETGAGGPSSTFAGASAYGDEVAWNAGSGAEMGPGLASGGYQRLPAAGGVSSSGGAYGSGFSTMPGESTDQAAQAGTSEASVGAVAAMGARHLVSLATGGGPGGGQGRPPLSSVTGRARAAAASAGVSGGGSGTGVELPPLAQAADRDKTA